MPVEGLPDRSKHRLCWRCQRWFLPHEGVIDYLPVRGPASFLLDRIARALEDDSRQRFFCDACHRSATSEQKRGKASGRLALLASVVMAAALVALWWFGVFDMLLGKR